MKYIPDIDEQIVAPPYALGTDDITYQFEVHHFLLDSKPGKLQETVDKHLNCVFQLERNDGEFQRARKRSNGYTSDRSVTLNYKVPEGTKARLSFLRYGRAFVTDQANLAALQYTEVILSCQVSRWVDGELDSQADEVLDFVGLIYIDDRAFNGKERDPYALPIIFGRELFGMPKAPGRIRYEPDHSDCGFPRLEIWVPKGGKRTRDYTLVPKPAIVFAGDPDRKVKRKSAPPVMPPREPPYTARERKKEGTKLILERKLVALKQFADPIRAADSDDLQACYQAVVESPLEYDSDSAPITFWGTLPDTEITFPELPKKLDIIGKFGLIEDGPRTVKVTSTNISYSAGHMIFASPERTAVWHLYP
jgi:hypothetical protein